MPPFHLTLVLIYSKTESARELQFTKAARLLLLHGVEDSAGELLGGGVAAHVAGPV
jgi:hypothetical protein